MSIYQNGVGNTKYGLSYVLPDDVYFSLLEPGSREFLENNLNNTTLTEIADLLFANEFGQNNYLKSDYTAQIQQSSKTDTQYDSEENLPLGTVSDNEQTITFGQQPTQQQAPVGEVKKKELFTLQKGESKKSFRKKALNFVDKITTNKDSVVAMSNNKTTGVISIDKNAMIQKFNDKAWTKPSKQLDGSYATPLSENEFNSVDEWFTFALIHEVKHDTIFKQEDETTGQYEDRINQAALQDLRQNYNVQQVTEVEPQIDKNMEAFNAEVSKLGRMPKEFIVGPSKWVLNNMNLYDLVDKNTGSILMKNMNMFTGQIVQETTLDTPVNQKQLYNFTKQLANGVRDYKLNQILALKGIDIEDVYTEISKVTTQSQLNDIINKILRAIC